MGNQHEVSLTEQGERGGQHSDIAEIRVTVDYLPAVQPFRGEYQGTVAIETVRMAAMAFFGVADRQERDKYQYFLEFDGGRVADTQRTLDQLFGVHRRGAHFHLIEQITPGIVAE